MQKIAVFEKVSLKEYCKFGNAEDYNKIILPKRATVGSAGYDFFAVFPFTLAPTETINIPTGIRVKIDEGWVLTMFPRSSLGFKYRLTLSNTVGIIDSDYYYAENEGHIFIKLINCGTSSLSVNKGQAFAQGVFFQYGITKDDDVQDIRIGGFGSTDKN